jgi:zinc protease
MTLARTQPAIHDAIDFEYNLPPIQEEKLQNGLPIYWLSAGVQDVAEINWVFPAGLWYEPKAAVANATAGMLKNGTAKRTAAQINEALEFYGASLGVNAGNDFATVTLHTLTRHLPALLPVVYEILTEAIFPEEELEIHKRNAIQRLLVNLRECEFVANQRIDALLFGADHPYGRFTRQEKIEAIQRQDVLDFYHTAYNLDGVKIFMAGNINEGHVKQVDAVFGSVQLQPRTIISPAHVLPVASPVQEHSTNDANGVQGAIRVARLFPNRHHPDYAPMVVLNTLFGGYFGSRLMSNIREDKGYTYGIYSSLSPLVNGGSITIHTEVGRDVVAPAVTEIYREMELLCQEEADEEELLLVKNYLLGGLLGDLDGPFSILQRWRMLILNGFTEEHFNNNIRIYKSVTAADLQLLAQKYLRKEDFYEVVVI